MCKVLKCKWHCIIISNVILYEDQHVFSREWVFATLFSSCHVVGPYVSCGNKIRFRIIWFHMPKIKILFFSRCPSNVASTRQELRIECNFASYICDTRSNRIAIPHMKVRFIQASGDTVAVLWIPSVGTREGDLAACSSRFSRAQSSHSGRSACGQPLYWSPVNPHSTPPLPGPQPVS